MIKLDGGIMLPDPPKKNPKGFTRPEGITQHRWDKDKEGRWYRAYMHCLYSLPLHLGLPLHSVVPRLAKKMKEADDSFNVSLRFMGEMELQGYVKFDSRRKSSGDGEERLVVATKKFLALKLDFELAPASSIKYPKLPGSRIPVAPIRNGVASDKNKEVSAISSRMAMETFQINRYVLGLLEMFPPEFSEAGSEYMYKRTMHCAWEMVGNNFRFPYFLDSRSRMYEDTTCGFSPQGADHEKALCLPTYKEVLNESGYKALLETAYGYSEIEWDEETIINMAKNPGDTISLWKMADKPYSFMACADLIRQYNDNPLSPISGFIPLDGRCSGLQHWSALTKSSAITAHLGMEKMEHNLDIYEKVARDWEEVLDPEWKFMATRKAAKIPVMTWGYNATVTTSMDWMEKLFGSKKKWSPELNEYVIAEGGVERTATRRKGAELFKNLNDTLGPLRAAVDWVSGCATEISKAGNVEVHWITPDGFEAMQRKVKGYHRDITCILSDNSRFDLDIQDFSIETPHTAKHRSAIAPNIIHSLDATHLRMVARKLDELGLPMIFIHDSFATHCNHREVLYNIIVDTFIELYSGDYMMELYDYWKNMYNVDIPKPPAAGIWEAASLKGCSRFFL